MYSYQSSCGATAWAQRQSAPHGGFHRSIRTILTATYPLWALGVCLSLSCASASRDVRVVEPLTSQAHAPAIDQDESPSHAVSKPATAPPPISAADAVAKGRTELERRDVDPNGYGVSARRSQLSWDLMFTPKPPVNRSLKVFVKIGLQGKVLGFRRSD